MKKIFVFMMAMLLAAPVVYAQNNKALEKARAKEYKTKMKEYKKEGWKIFGSSRSIDVSLLTHYDKLNKLGEKGYELVGICAKYKSDNVGYQVAANNAATMYARTAGSTLKGRLVSDLAADGVDTSSEFDHFYAAYESLVEKEIKGELRQSYAVYKDLGNGEKTMQVFYIVDEEAATNARIRAYNNALRESEAAQKMADKISDFVKKGFDQQGGE
ncbi:MAG: hypothetical protein SOW56_02705 [Bacteroidaceae bacterium]|nr:hypothetical protein [Prevotellaceae bacterium]MDY3062925.1 hypothetical protein [Bacteroidaceae bacterium]